MALPLKRVDVTDNPFRWPDEPRVVAPDGGWGLLSLGELEARAVQKGKVPYADAGLPKTLVSQLHTAGRCSACKGAGRRPAALCGRPPPDRAAPCQARSWRRSGWCSAMRT